MFVLFKKTVGDDSVIRPYIFLKDIIILNFNRSFKQVLVYRLLNKNTWDLKF